MHRILFCKRKGREKRRGKGMVYKILFYKVRKKKKIFSARSLSAAMRLFLTKKGMAVFLTPSPYIILQY